MSNTVDVTTSINTVNNLVNSIKQTKADLTKNFLDISANISEYEDKTLYLEKHNSVYNYYDSPDPQTLLMKTEPKDIKYVMNQDINQIKLYQNTIYISGVIAVATLFIGLIITSGGSKK